MPSDRPLRLVVFDCDGTLVDSQHVIVAAMTEAWSAAGRDDPPAARDIRRVVGLPLVEAVANLLPEGSRNDSERVADHYRTAFRSVRARPDHYEPLYPGVGEVLDRLDRAGVLLGIATGKGRDGLFQTLDHHGLAGRFVTQQTSDVAAGKPAPDMLLRAMSETGADPDNTVMIGDTVFDILMAKAAQVAAIGVSWGYHEVGELRSAGAQAVVDRFDALPSVIDDMIGLDHT